MFLVDTNVLLDIFTDDAKWRPWSERAVGDALVTGDVGVNPIIFAETSLAFADANTLDRHLDDLMIVRLQLPYGAAFRRGGLFSDTGVRVGCARRRCRTSTSGPTPRRTI